MKKQKALIISALLCSLPMLAQSTTGELRLTVADPAGLSVKATVELVSQGTQYRETFVANSQGEVDARRLPNAGLRWDHYQLLLNQSAVSPRFAVSRFFPTLNLNIHGAHDRIFQTPSN